MSTQEFQYDLFLSHSAKDKAVVRPLTERLRVAVRKHLKVWFDEWVLKPGDSIPAKIEDGPFQFGTRNSEFGIAQAGTFRFRDPLNQERRFIPLRLDDAPAGGSPTAPCFGRSLLARGIFLS